MIFQSCRFSPAGSGAAADGFVATGFVAGAVVAAAARRTVRRMYRPSVIRTTLSSSTAGTATRVRIRNFESQYGLPSSCRTRTGWSTTRSRYGTTLFACVSSPGSGSTRTS